MGSPRSDAAQLAKLVQIQQGLHGRFHRSQHRLAIAHSLATAASLDIGFHRAGVDQANGVLFRLVQERSVTQTAVAIVR